ncbi:MAG: hypothetical protein Q4G08_05065 [Capnocytophaga sp.]|nr:hypothetical protein [Capnocytophaga sp.]
MRLGFLFILLAGTSLAYSQSFENTKRETPLVVPIETAPEINAPVSNYKLPFSAKSNETSLLNKSKKEIDFTGQSKLVRRKVDFKPNYGMVNAHKREEYDVPKGDQFFGDFFNNGKYVRVYCRDHQAEDGDRVSILVNGKVEIHDIYLTNQAKGFQITLQPGFNKIEFLALNQGDSGPNTAEFRVIDDTGNTISSAQWNLATGSKAHFVIVKEEVENTTQEE